MRLLVYVLLLFNVLFFAWARWIDVPAKPDAGLLGVAPLQLAGSQATSAAAPPSCQSFGPLTDAQAAAAVGKALAVRGVTTRERLSERTVDDGFNVFIGGFKNASSQQVALRRLSQAGINDAVALSGPGQELQVSAGLFADESNAERRVQDVLAAGYTPKMEPRHHQLTVHWLDTEGPAGRQLPKAAELSVPAAAWSACPKPGT
jgi:hypothetical protein